MQSIPRTSTRSPRVAWSLLAALVLLAPSCKLFSSVIEAPGRVLSPGSSKERSHPARVQTAVMRFADGYNVSIVQATRQFAEIAGTQEAKIQGLSWAISQTSAALAIACGSNPNANLLDMLVLVKLGRTVHEEHWSEIWGEADRPMVEAYTKLEEDIELTARDTLSLKELEEVNQAIQLWREEHPDQSFTGFVRLPGFRNLLEARREKARSERESDPFAQLADLVSLDPFAGLEPAKREVELARYLGERTLFYAQRAPLIFGMQAELLGLKLAAMPQVENALATSDRFTRSAESIAATAAALPDVLTEQREGLVRDLERVNGPARELLTEARTTLDSVEQGSAALEKAIVSFDTMMERFEPDPAKEAERAGKPPGRPFDVTEYGAAAARVGEAAEKLDQLMASFDEKQPRIENLVSGTAKSILNRALIYGLVLIAAVALAVLAVRRISGRWIPARRGPPPEPKAQPRGPTRFFPHEV